MTLTSHSIIGAAIANLVPANPEIGFALAFASHYLSDMVPHAELVSEDSIIEKRDDGDSFDKKNLKSIFHNAESSFGFLLIGLDFAVAIILCMFIFVRNRESLIATIAGIIGGVLPDFLQFLYYKIRKEPFIFLQKIHNFFHNPDKMKDKPIKGIATQIITVAIVVGIYCLLR